MKFNASIRHVFLVEVTLLVLFQGNFAVQFVNKPVDTSGELQYFVDVYKAMGNITAHELEADSQEPKANVSTSRRQGAVNFFRQVLHNHHNVQYYANFEIGGQPISGIFDTGSFELLVRSSRCSRCEHPTAPYCHERSKTYVKNGTIAKHVFGSGPCISMLGYDTVTVGNDFISKKQAFWEIIDHRIPVLNKAKFAAIVGIGPNFAYANSEKTLLMSYGVDEFSVCLKRASGGSGYLQWGSDPANKLKDSDYLTAKVIGKQHWVANLSGATFFPENKSMAGPCSNSPCAAIIDSGTSLIAAPGMALMELSAMIGPVMEDCSNIHELPTLHFTIGGHDFALPPQAYIMRVSGATVAASDFWDILFFKPKIKRIEQCMPAFMQMDMMSQVGPVWILGMPFFRYFHTTFDRKNEQIRFAGADANCEPVSLNSTNRKRASLMSKSTTYSSEPLDINLDALVPPRLSGMMDYPFTTGGELVL